MTSSDTTSSSNDQQRYDRQRNEDKQNPKHLYNQTHSNSLHQTNSYTTNSDMTGDGMKTNETAASEVETAPEIKTADAVVAKDGIVNDPETKTARLSRSLNSGIDSPETKTASETPSGHQYPLRIVLAKLGFDGHDRGIKVVARILRDAGFEVIYLGLRQTTESVIAAAEQEDADAIGLSIHNGGHMTLAPRMVDALRGAGLDVPVIVGGIVPAVDVPLLLEAGVAAVLGPGASAAEVNNTIRAAVAETRASS